MFFYVTDFYRWFMIQMLTFLDLISFPVRFVYNRFCGGTVKKFLWYLFLAVLCIAGIFLLFIVVSICLGAPILLGKIHAMLQPIYFIFGEAVKYGGYLLSCIPSCNYLVYMVHLINMVYLRIALYMQDLELFKTALIESNFKLLEATLNVVSKTNYPSWGMLMINHFFHLGLYKAHVKEISDVLKRLEFMKKNERRSWQINFLGDLIENVKSDSIMGSASWKGMEEFKDLKLSK